MVCETDNKDQSWRPYMYKKMYAIDKILIAMHDIVSLFRYSYISPLIVIDNMCISGYSFIRYFPWMFHFHLDLFKI